MAKFLIALVVLLGVIFLIANFAEFEQVAQVLQHGDWRYLAAGLLVELLGIVAVGAGLRAIYTALGNRERLRAFIPLVVAANFANVVAPSGGVSGMAVFIAHARQNNLSSARATIAGALFVLYDYAGFLGFLALGLFVLFRRNNLNPPELIASGILVFVAIVIAVLLYLGMRSAQDLGRALAWMARGLNRLLHPFLRREYVSEQRAHDFAQDAASGLVQLRRNPRGWVLPFAWSFVSKAMLLAIFLLSFLAFDVPLSPGTLVAGFSLAYLFSIVSPTPAGIGVVEGLLALALNSMYLPLSAAVVVTLSYRAITFWVPFFIGMLSFRWLARSPTPSLPSP